jgi:tetratricopeptide (TPR) repeat protein
MDEESVRVRIREALGDAGASAEFKMKVLRDIRSVAEAEARVQLGVQVRAARQELGLSLAAVAGEHFSRAFLNQVELGRAQPSTRTLQIIAERLQRPIEYFLEDPEVSGPAIELTLTECQSRLIRGEGERARSLVERLLTRTIPLEARTRAQLVLAEVHLKARRTSEALKLLRQALEAAEKAGWTPLAAEICDRIGSAHYLARRRHEAARWFDRALAAYEASGLSDPALKARILGHRANIHFAVGESQEAIVTYQAAIAAAEQMDLPGLAGIYEGLAAALQREEKASSALSYAQRSLRIFETMRDVRMSAQLRHNMADILLQQGQPAQAQRLFDEGTRQLEGIGDSEMLPFLLAGAAEARLEQHDIAGAAALAARAKESMAHSSDPLAAVAALRVEGRVAHAQGDTIRSRADFDEALARAAQMHNADLYARVSYDYARTLSEQGELAQAMARFREAYQAHVRRTRRPARSEAEASIRAVREGSAGCALEDDSRSASGSTVEPTRALDAQRAWQGRPQHSQEAGARNRERLGGRNTV